MDQNPLFLLGVAFTEPGNSVREPVMDRGLRVDELVDCSFLCLQCFDEGVGALQGTGIR